MSNSLWEKTEGGCRVLNVTATFESASGLLVLKVGEVEIDRLDRMEIETIIERALSQCADEFNLNTPVDAAMLAAMGIDRSDVRAVQLSTGMEAPLVVLLVWTNTITEAQLAQCEEAEDGAMRIPDVSFGDHTATVFVNAYTSH